MPITTCIFDAYGTLLDVNAAAREAAAQPGRAALAEIWPQLAAHWRDKQLQYTWLRAVAGQHVDFWQVTQDGLDWAMQACTLDDPELRETLLSLYYELAAFPEVPDMLHSLKARGIATGILSNGTPDMLNAACASAQISTELDAILSVQSVGIFKPHNSVYQMVLDHFGCARDEVLFVSSNGWDAAGASGFGFQTVWVNRTGLPQDRLWATPHNVLPDLTKIPDLL